MNDVVGFLRHDLSRTTLLLAAVGVVLWLVLKLLKVQSPLVHRAACLATLLTGWTVLQLPVEIPWHEPPPVTLPISDPTPVPAGPLARRAPPAVEFQTPPVDFEIPQAMPAATAISVDLVPDRVRPAPPEWNWRWPLAVAWLSGIVALVIAWLGAYAWFVLRLPRSLAAPEAWHSQWRELLARHRLRAIPLRVTDEIGPLLCRLPWGYELIVPEGLWSELDDEARLAILRHELAHYRRGDVGKSFFVRLLMLPHWFNPVAWWAVRRFDEAAEWAADRAACGDEPTTEYARLLVRLGELAGPRAQLGTAFRGRSLAARIRRLIATSQGKESRMKTLFVAIVACGLLAAAGLNIKLVAQERPPERRVPPPSPPAALPQEAVPRNDAARPAPRNAAVVEGQGAEEDRAAEKMANAAKEAYDAAAHNHIAQTATMEDVYLWSRRWMEAALLAARSAEQQRAALDGHLFRMKQLHKKTEVLFKLGAKGGEAVQMRSANYYVAEAERLLAELDRKPKAPPVRREPPRLEPPAEKMPPETPASRLPVDEAAEKDIFRAAPVDEADDKDPFGAPDAAPRADEPEPADPFADPQPAPDRDVESLFEEPSQESRLIIPEPEKNVPPATRTSAEPAQKRAPPAPEQIRGLQGWAGLLQREPDPKQRIQALGQMVQFAQQGQGADVAKHVMELMRGYSSWLVEQQRDPQLKTLVATATRAVTAGGQDAMPTVVDALKNGNKNQRVFALRVLVQVMPEMDPAIALLDWAADDPHTHVRQTARMMASQADRFSPQVKAMLRKGLSHPDSRDVLNTIWIVVGLDKALAPANWPKPGPFPELYPELQWLTKDPSRDDEVRHTAQAALDKMEDPGRAELVAAYKSALSAADGKKADFLMNQLQVLGKYDEQGEKLIKEAIQKGKEYLEKSQQE